MVSPAQPGPVDPRLDLAAEVLRLKREMNAVILAHYYQYGEVQDLADFVGDSLALAQQAAKTTADCIVFCGVHFMGETAKILNPDKPVYLPDLAAGCSLSDSCQPSEFRAFLERHPGAFVVTYVNSSAEVKTLSDVICTSSNAAAIVSRAPRDQPIVFAPDKHLGAWVRKQTGRDMLLWPGACIVHETFSEKKIVQLMVRHPEAEVVAHPECDEGVLQHAHYVGSTRGIVDHVVRSPRRQFIVATESGVLHTIKKAAPDKECIPAPTLSGCACSECPHMKLNTLEKLYACMRDRRPEIAIPEAIRLRALAPLQRMLEWS